MYIFYENYKKAEQLRSEAKELENESFKEKSHKVN